MFSSNDPTKREAFDFDKLHPKAREAFRGLAGVLEDQHRAGLLKSHFKPFEGHRSNERQNYLFNVAKTTKARAWQSAHNYGLAVDFVAWRDGKWSWAESEDWNSLAYFANQRGLIVPIKWDRPHIEHPIWSAIKRSIV